MLFGKRLGREFFLYLVRSLNELGETWRQSWVLMIDNAELPCHCHLPDARSPRLSLIDEEDLEELKITT